MSVLVYAEQSCWLQLPSSFPTATEQLPREWENEVIAGMRDAWRGKMDPQNEEAAREALRYGLRRVRSDDSVTLQYWPSASIANAVVHVVAREFGPDEKPIGIPLDDDVAYVAAPVVEAFETDFLGTGVEVRYLGASEEDPQLVLGAAGYLFENSHGFVFVGVDATLPQLLGVMLEPLREVVRSIRVTDDDDGRDWDKAAFDVSAFASTGEEWILNDASGGVAR